MPSQFPSLQSFISSTPSIAPIPPPANLAPPELFPPSFSHTPSSPGFEPGDGFTADELDTALHPPSAQWAPTHDYEEMQIGRLEAGPKYVTFTGRIVNFYDMARASKKPLAAKGCLKLMVGDDAGAVTIRLWYADVRYTVRLGQMVTVWTVHVSRGDRASLAPEAAPLFTSVFPERERSCHVVVHDSDDGVLCKKPYSWRGTGALPGLMTLKNFGDGGYDVGECKVLVCVRSMGARKEFSTKSGYSSELISIGVFDDTAEAVLTLTGAVCESASYWQPFYTVLLISNPGWRTDRTVKLSLSANTRIDIDPDMQDALWLRDMAQRMTRREHVNPPFPDSIFDTVAAETAAVRILYTLADIDEFARSNPKERFMGYISVVITEVNLVISYKRNMLMSTECCGLPICANTLFANCRQCEKSVSLRINPRIIGPVIDETGQVASGKLTFSDSAWTQLLGQTPEQLVTADLETLKAVERRLLFQRVSLGFGWCLEGSQPLLEDDETVDLRPWQRKRKRLDVRGKKTTVREKVQVEESGKSETEGKKIELDESKGEGDGLSQVGRMCIWCVK